VLVNAEHVSKKFCRSLRRSLYYGMVDIAGALRPWSSGGGATPLADGELPPLRRDEFFALRDVSFELKRGECLGLIGHNGAGKSTLLKILNGLVPPDAGRITTRGRVAALIELNAGFNPILSGRENIYSEAALLGFSREEIDARFDGIVEFAEVGDFIDMPVQNYSSGMKVRLGFAVATQMEPDILIIDEVLAVGDVAFRFKCLYRIGELMRSAAVIFVTHTMPQVFRLCDDLIVLDHGSVRYHGRNVSEGVAEYLGLFKQSDNTISGSGEATVTSFRVESNASSAGFGDTLRVPFGSELRMSARIQAAPGIREGRVQFLLWNAEMLPVMDIMSEELAGFPVEFSRDGSVEVTAFVPRTEINGGKYTVSVIAASRDYGRTYCRHDNAAYVQVDAETASGAHTLSVAEWSVIS
jgi:lipopolysaccharide transport system ATP-binding protein